MSILETNHCVNYETNINNYICFEVKGFETIAEQGTSNGIRVNMIGHISNTKTPFSIDLGVGDVVVPSPTRMLYLKHYKIDVLFMNKTL